MKRSEVMKFSQSRAKRYKAKSQFNEDVLCGKVYDVNDYYLIRLVRAARGKG